MLDNETKLIIGKLKSRFDGVKREIGAGQNVTFVCLIKSEGSDAVELYNFGDPDAVLSVCLAQIESLIIRVANTSQARAEGADLVMAYFRQLRDSFLDGSFDGKTVELDAESLSNVPDGSFPIIFDGGEQ